MNSTRNYSLIRDTLGQLSAFEIDALIDALRRDMRVEELRDHDGEHTINAKRDRGILEALLPKHAEGRSSKVSLPVAAPKRHIHDLAKVLVEQQAA